VKKRPGGVLVLSRDFLESLSAEELRFLVGYASLFRKHGSAVPLIACGACYLLGMIAIVAAGAAGFPSDTLTFLIALPIFSIGMPVAMTFEMKAMKLGFRQSAMELSSVEVGLSVVEKAASRMPRYMRRRYREQMTKMLMES
jgi:hypothetical protein